MKAKIVEFNIRTRVVIKETGDEDKDFEAAVKKAREQILSDPENYIFGDNVPEGGIEDDEECPAGTMSEDYK